MDENCMYYRKGKDEEGNDVEACAFRKLVFNRNCETECPKGQQPYICRECNREFVNAAGIGGHISSKRVGGHGMKMWEYREKHGLKGGQY